MNEVQIRPRASPQKLESPLTLTGDPNTILAENGEFCHKLKCWSKKQM